MNQSIFLTKYAFHSLVSNLLELEESISVILDEFCPGPSTEAEELKQILNDYLRRMDDTLRNISITETAKNEFPFVIVNSEVMIEETASLGVYRNKLISPLKDRVEVNEISFLSPMGKALLLKNVKDNIVVEMPGGDFHYKILSVRIIGDLKSSRFTSSLMKASSNG
ncbi:MAG TPA: GreA/GreB family elongation factor [Bacillota bacterium]|nr:GreA/GreB family elongation factor [Bacillota bacterium]